MIAYATLIVLVGWVLYRIYALNGRLEGRHCYLRWFASWAYVSALILVLPPGSVRTELGMGIARLGLEALSAYLLLVGGLLFFGERRERDAGLVCVLAGGSAILAHAGIGWPLNWMTLVVRIPVLVLVLRRWRAVLPPHFRLMFVVAVGLWVITPSLMVVEALGEGAVLAQTVATVTLAFAIAMQHYERVHAETARVTELYRRAVQIQTEMYERMERGGGGVCD